MPDERDIPGPEESQTSRIGVDEWVASHEGRRERGRGLVGRAQEELGRVPRPAFYAGFGVAAAFLPAARSSHTMPPHRDGRCRGGPTGRRL